MTAGLPVIFLIDFLSFAIAVGVLLVVRFPQPPRSRRASAGLRGLLVEARAGLDFVIERRALLILLLSFVVVNFAFAFQGVLTLPLLLSIGSERAAGAIISVGALGIMAGSLVLSLWGGPRDRVAGVFLPIIAMGAGLILMGARASFAWVVVGIVLMNGTHPIAGGSSQAIWQSKVPADLQGRVFAVRQVSAIAASPIAFLSAGFLADRVFEPLMASDRGVLTDLLGSGPGRGIGLLFAVSGILAVAAALAAWNHPDLRNIDESIPDLEPESIPAAA